MPSRTTAGQSVPGPGAPGPGTGRAAVRLVALHKSFGSLAAVAGVDLEIAEGEFFTMLGPSGSGKTTLLRLIAGFERPDSGTVELGGADVTRQPPYARNVNTVFQDYALFPHMSVLQNVEYGLRVRRVARAERAAARRARPWTWSGSAGSAAASRSSCPAASGSGSRWPGPSSTSPRCCCSTSRSAPWTPSCARRCRSELKRIQREVGITFVYVTHDQEEALTMSDRLAVFDQGRIEQLGTPVEVYEQPASDFVAGFIGISNLLERDGRRITVRPEKVRLLAAGESAAAGQSRSSPAGSSEVVYLGMLTRYVVTLDAGGQLVAVRQNLDGYAADVVGAAGRRSPWPGADQTRAYEITP